MKNRVLKTEKLPFIEVRYISQVLSCDKKHEHDELTLTAIKTGNINILFNNKNDLLAPNKISVVNPNEVHCATLSNLDSLGCYVLYLDKVWCVNIQKSLFTEYKDFLPISTSLLQDRDLYNNFILICDKLFIDDISTLEKEEKLINFMSDVFLKFCRINKLEKIDIKTSKLAYKIQNYLNKNIENDILLEDIADYMKLSIVHILRIFKKEFGLPIHSYILNQKVHFAKELLSKNIPVSEIAQISGFFDQSHFNKSFKRVFQLTPKEYQKNIFS